MSKRKHKSRKDTRREITSDNVNNANVNNNSNTRQTYNNGPFGINPNQLLSSMFGNIDMSQISSILQSMNTQGFDFNNLNLGNLKNLMGNMGNMGNVGASGGRVGEVDVNGQDLNENKNEEDDDIAFSNITGNNIKNSNERNDENIQMLRAIRSIVGDERGGFIDKIIRMYNNGDFD